MLRIRNDIELFPLTLEHAPNMYRWMRDTTVSLNIGLRSEPSLEKTKAWITNALQDPSIYPFAILLDGSHVGNVILDRIDNYLQMARLSVYIGEPSTRHLGVGLTGIYLALNEGFNKMKLYKIWLTVHARNYAAINTYTQLGFVLEGILRNEFKFEGQRLNLLYMGLLFDDFKSLYVEK